MKKILFVLLVGLAMPAAANPVGSAAGRGSQGVFQEHETTGSLQAWHANGGPGRTSIVPGDTGASTIETDSAAGGNAEQPERNVPQYGGGGGGGQ